MTFRGHVQNGVIILEDDIKIPEGTPVQIEISDTGVGKTLAERFKEVIGIVDDLPSDMAENHDHYIHGTPKK